MPGHPGRPPVLAPELKAEAGMILVLSRDGTPVLQPVFYGERRHRSPGDDDGIEVVASVEVRTSAGAQRLSKRLVDELAMQRRDVLALHVASDPGLALDIMVFTLADADTHDWRSRAATTAAWRRAGGSDCRVRSQGCAGERALAELRSGLDESWRAGEDASSRFDVSGAVR
jgi:ParB family chromosome partitioning protein